jgi:hypothetical protein
VRRAITGSLRWVATGQTRRRKLARVGNEEIKPRESFVWSVSRIFITPGHLSARRRRRHDSAGMRQCSGDSGTQVLATHAWHSGGSKRRAPVAAAAHARVSKQEAEMWARLNI